MTSRKAYREQIESLRGQRMEVERQKPFAVCSEREPASKTDVTDVLTVFLVGAECSFRCTMCDLWKYTLPHATIAGDIPIQLRSALTGRSNERWIKLYNASNFFSSSSIPTSDLEEIANLCSPFERVIVENHPKIWNRSIDRFNRMLGGKLEIAMGLETIHPVSRNLLNKEFTLQDFEEANKRMQELDIDRRVFIMLQPPGTSSDESVDWVFRTLEYAERQGIRHASIIPTRGGNGMMEQLQAQGLFTSPTLTQLELCLERALRESWSILVTADLWNLNELRSSCTECVAERIKRLEGMNLLQKVVSHESYACDCNLS